MDCLIIKKKWLDLILSGKKTLEIRGSRIHKRGKIGLIESGSGEIKGTCELVDCIGPLSKNDFKKNQNKHQSKLSNYKTTYAWVLTKPKRFSKPKKYKHPQGAVMWVKLKE